MSMLTTVLPSTSDPTNNILPVVFVVIAIVVIVVAAVLRSRKH
ncbi:hypothetical protein [Olsenella sp. Marseille-QA0557]